jgi:hypothetical protein
MSKALPNYELVCILKVGQFEDILRRLEMADEEELFDYLNKVYVRSDFTSNRTDS